MRSVRIWIHGVDAGRLQELVPNQAYRFIYSDGYMGQPVSLTMPILKQVFNFSGFPPFLEGLLPEGPQLEGLLSLHSIDKNDFIAQLVTVGEDMPGCITISGEER